MTGFLFGSILLLTVACWVKLGDADARPLVIAFLAAAPLLLFSTIVIFTFATAPAGEYRVALEAVEFDLAAGSNAVTVGGGTDGDEADDVIVRDLPPRYLTFRVEEERVVVTLPADLDHAVENPAHAAVRIDKEKPFANSVALTNGRQIEIEGFGATSPVIPRRDQEITEGWKIPILRNLTAETAMYPLRFWSRASGSDEVVTGPEGAPLGSFLSYEGGFRQTRFVTLTGDGTTVSGLRYEPRIAMIEQGAPRRLALFRLDYADPKLDDDSRSRAQQRRSFRASYEKGRLAMVFDTPDFVRLAPESIKPLVDQGSFLLATRDPRRNMPIVAKQMVLAFPQLGPRVQNELFTVIRVSESGDCRVRVTSHTGTSCYASGEAFRVGDRAAAILRVTDISTPWGIIATLFVLAFFAQAWMRRQERDTVAIIIISAAEVLLAVRLLIAFEGALLDPSSAAGLWESLVIFALLPFTLRVAWAAARVCHPDAEKPTEDLRIRRPFTPLRVTVSVLLEGAAILALVAIALTRANVSTSRIVVVCTFVAVVSLGAGWLANLVIDRVTAHPWSFRAIFAFAFFVGILRAALLFVGWKERISVFDANLALTVIYLPVVLLFFAMLWQKYRDFSLGGDAGVAPAAAGVLLTILALVVIALTRANVATRSIVVVCAAIVVVPLAVGLVAKLMIHRATAHPWSLRANLTFATVVAAVRNRTFALANYTRRSGKRITVSLAAAVVGALLAIGIPWFVKDSGSALVHVPAIVLLFALPVLVRWNRITWPLALPLAAILVFHIAVAAMPYLLGQEKDDPAFQKALSNATEANEFMAERLGQSTNQLRVLSHVAPHQLEQAGTSKAEGLVMQRRMLDRYGGTGFFGAGYLDVPLTVFGDTHMNDNLSAIHILAPFGMVGAIGILALLLALALLPLRAHFGAMSQKDLETPERAINQRTALGMLALWTFSLCGIYMIAANLGLVLFTGKNVYLLAATSNSDAIEGGVLLLITLVALVPTKAKANPDAPASPAPELAT